MRAIRTVPAEDTERYGEAQRQRGTSMYGWIWRRLPGPIALRVVIAGLLVLAVVALLFGVIFPKIEPHLPWNDVDVDQPG